MDFKVMKILKVVLLMLLFFFMIYLMTVYNISDANKQYDLVFLKEYQHREKDTIEQRLTTLRNGCKSHLRKSYIFNFSQTIERFYVDEKANLSYCKVPKAGSSFWTKIFLMLQSNDARKMRLGSSSLGSVFETNRDKLHTIGNSFGTKRPLDDQNLHTINILVSRDPYSRLFSAYVDKYFLLGHISLARSIAIEKFKGNFKMRSDGCGYDISFQDFLDRVVENSFSGKSINRHWSPVYLLCHPCDVRYDIVSKVETLTHDVEYTINISNVRQATKNNLKEVFEGKCLNDTVTSNIRALYNQWEKNKSVCPIKVNFFSKVLKALKIQGILSNKLVIPERDITSITVEKFTEIVLHSIALHPLTKEEKKKQRKAALDQAWKSIDRKTIKKIQKLYSLDFMLFEYDIKPPS